MVNKKKLLNNETATIKNVFSITRIIVISAIITAALGAIGAFVIGME